MPIPSGKACFATEAGQTTRAADDATRPTPELRFVIALVTDPVQTHLPLVFDRSVEAIQEGVQDSGYSYDGSWFPWNISDKKYESLTDEEQAAELAASLQEQPGIMVFRLNPKQNVNGAAVGEAEPEGPKGNESSSDERKQGNGKQQAPPITESELKPYGAGLVVFLVSEQPTGGVNGTQFQHALQWMQVLRTSVQEKRLLILGPTFSGSLLSLARELDAQVIPQGSEEKPKLGAFQQYPEVLVYSGSANSEDSLKWFNQFLNDRQRPSPKPEDSEDRKTPPKLGDPENHFRTFSEGDTLMTDRFLCYLRHENYDLSRVAILSEDETAFGGAAVGGALEKGALKKKETEEKKENAVRCQGDNQKQSAESPKYLYYPRDIATLRSAYEEQSIFGSGKQQANAPATSLRGNLSEPASAEHDTVRTYSGQLTPLAQEAVLFGIANTLQAKDIEFVILRGSNTLDQLFLAQFLGRAYPSGRVVIDGSDLMFRRGMQGGSLRGVMLLSTYPLLTWTQDAMPSLGGKQGADLSDSPGSYRVFPQDFIEGIYVATRVLLKDGAEADSGVPITDYGTPGVRQGNEKAAGRPATWLTVVGHRQFWAIAILNDSTEVEKNTASEMSAKNDGGPFGPQAESLLVPEYTSSTSQGAAPAGKHRQGLPGEMTGLLAACAALALWHLYCCWNGSIVRPPRVRAYFAPIAKVQHTALVFLGGLLMGLLGITLGMVLHLAVPLMSPWYSIPIFVAVIIIILCSYLGCVSNYRLHVVSGESAPKEESLIKRWRKNFLIVFFPTLLALGFLRYVFLTQRLGPANMFPTFWRSIYLRSGVSPLLPQVLLLAGLYFWFWYSLRGLALFGDDRPLLPPVDDLPAMPDPRKSQEHRVMKILRVFSQEGAGENIERNAIPLGRRYLKPLLWIVPISVAAMWTALGNPSFRSLGDRRYGVLIFIGVAVCIVLILADIWQMSATWSQLRQLLNFLDRLRLRRTFGSLKGLLGSSIWTLSGNVLQERYQLISRQLECLSNLRSALVDCKDEDEHAPARAAVVQRIDEFKPMRDTFVAWYVDLLDDEVADPDKLSNVAPLRELQKGLAALSAYLCTNLIMPVWQNEPWATLHGGDDKSSASEGPCAPAQYLRRAEEFFLLPYLGFIQNILGRLRTLGLSMAALFLAMTLAVSSYPFDPLPTIAAVFLILFVIVGAVSVFVYAEMSRDATLSRITDTDPGQLGWSFWAKLATFGLPPLLGLLTTLFPSMSDFVVSVLQPGVQAFK